MDINNRFNGEVQIVTGTGYLVTLDLNTDPITIIEEVFFPFHHNYAINNLGVFCGYKEQVGKGKQKDPEGAFRSDQLENLQDGRLGGMDINSNGDVVVGVAALYHDEFGLLDLNKDLVVNYPKGGQIFDVRGMTDRDATGFPKICGRAIEFGAFVLTPFNLTP